MNSSAPYPYQSSLVPSPRSKSVHPPWIWSLTVICFLFGGLTAMQLRAVQQTHRNLEDLRLVAGMTSVAGQGVTVTLADGPKAAQNGGSFLPGIVHDFDLQQTVHELLSAKAEAIAIKGAGGNWIRITGYTPIRCVGPTIYVNFKSCAAPFTIAAIGNPATLKNALEMPRGIIDNLKQQTLGVKIAPSSNLQLPAMEGIPHFSDAKVVDEQAKVAKLR